jgi:uncharacterized protein (UPF0332 family)
MKEEIRILINYRLERASEAIEEAKLLLDQGYANTFVNRLYYACFYSVSALLLSHELSSSKHSGIRSLFHQNFIKSGSIDNEFGRIYDKLFDNRQKGDYADLVRYDVAEVSEWLDEAKRFINEIKRVIKALVP